MHDSQLPYRQLLEQIRATSSRELVDGVVRPWLAAHAVREWAFFGELAARPGAPIPDVSEDESWRLYALSRNHDVLVSRRWATANPDERTAVALAHVELMTQLGFRPIARRPFHPFFHEIVAAEAAEPAVAPIEIVEEVWPGFMLGTLMFARVGVLVRGGASHLDPRIATTSTLYWAYERSNRETLDASFGWGNNSQWRTELRRDYSVGDELFYNVDGDIAHRAHELSDATSIELVRHRCLVLARRDSTDLYPYRERVRERNGVALLW